MSEIALYNDWNDPPVLVREAALYNDWNVQPWQRMLPIFNIVPATFGEPPLAEQLRAQLRQKYGENLQRALDAARTLEELDELSYDGGNFGPLNRSEPHSSRETQQRPYLNAKYIRNNRSYHFEISLGRWMRGIYLTAIKAGLDPDEARLVEPSMFDLWHVPEDCDRAVNLSSCTGSIALHAKLIHPAMFHYANLMIATLETAIEASMLIRIAVTQMKLNGKANRKKERVDNAEWRILAMCHPQWAAKEQVEADISKVFFAAYIGEDARQMIHGLLDAVLVYDKYEVEHNQTGIETCTAAVANVEREVHR